jgi:hypothetical protein
MSRLAEMDEYDSMFGRRLVDEDFLAAGYSPQEVHQYRGAIVQPSLTPQDRSAMEAQYGTLQEPDPTLRQRGAATVQDALIRRGLDPYVAGSYSRRILGDTAPTDEGLGIGVADFTPLGALFAMQEGGRTARSGYEQGDPLRMGLGALEAGLGILEATPLTAAIGRGIAATAQRMDPNTLYSVFGPPRAPSATGEAQGIRAYQGSPHDFNAERLVRYPDGRTEYIVGRPDVLPDVPAGAEVLRDFPMGRMRMDKIGTGEGAQAYGYGLYTAEAEGVARMYRDQLSSGNTSAARRTLEAAEGDVDQAITQTRQRIDRLNERAAAGDFGGDERRFAAQRQIQEDKLQQLLSFKETGSFDPGRMYEVNIRANPEDFLDYDAPLSAQPRAEAAVGRYLESALDQPGPIDERIFQMFERGEMTGADVARLIGQDVDPLLKEGIPGVRYFDEGSRATSGGQILGVEQGADGWVAKVRVDNRTGVGFQAPTTMITTSKPFASEQEALNWANNKVGGGTRNYVVFDENLIEIVRKYGIAGAAAMLGVSAFDVEQAIAQNLPPSEWDRVLVGPQ